MVGELLVVVGNSEGEAVLLLPMNAVIVEISTCEITETCAIEYYIDTTSTLNAGCYNA